MDIEEQEDPLLKVVVDIDCISGSIHGPSKADLTQQKGKHCYLKKL
jgi:hypothetical protein